MRRKLLLVAGLLLAACSPPAEDKTLKFEDAWVRSTPPGAMMTAGFGRLANHSDVLLEIIAFSSPAFGDVSLHRTVIENGVSEMREIPALSIPPGDSVELAPGGYHLMLMMPRQASESLAHIELQFELTAGQRFTFVVPVERR
jgi:copper(I)-binding protein